MRSVNNFDYTGKSVKAICFENCPGNQNCSDNTSALWGAFDCPRYHVLRDRYGHYRIVLVTGRGAAMRIVDDRPRLARAA